MTLTRVVRRAAAAPRQVDTRPEPGGSNGRRTFLQTAGLTAAMAALSDDMPFEMIEPVHAAQPAAANNKAEAPQLKRTICSHCSVGCSVNA